jgi:inorganic pyrophosphatase
MSGASFWVTLDQLLAEHRVVIDRPRGKPHPRYPDLIYPLDYGYVDGTSAADGAGIDVWIGSLPQRALTGILLSFDTSKRDAEIKLLLACTPADVGLILGSTGASMRYLFIPRPQDP